MALSQRLLDPSAGRPPSRGSTGWIRRCSPGFCWGSRFHHELGGKALLRTGLGGRRTWHRDMNTLWPGDRCGPSSTPWWPPWRGASSPAGPSAGRLLRGVPSSSLRPDPLGNTMEARAKRRTSRPGGRWWTCSPAPPGDPGRGGGGRSAGGGAPGGDLIQGPDPGSRIPSDGEVRGGGGDAVHEVHCSRGGRSRVEKGPGDPVIGGTVEPAPGAFRYQVTGWGRRHPWPGS